MNDIYEALRKLNINFTEHNHPAVLTCEEADKFYENIDGGKSKNLFLRNKKGDRHYLVILESSKQLDLKKLSELLNESKLGFASPDRLIKYLGLMPGAVSVFGLINDRNKEVIVVVDNDLLKYEKLHYHPNVNTATLAISKDDFLKFLNWTKNEILFLDL